MEYSHIRTNEVDMSNFPSHMHNEYEILYFLEGDADYTIEGSLYTLRKHDVLVIRPRTYHNLLPKSNAFYERYVINFAADELPDGVADALSELSPACSVGGDPFITGFFEAWGKYEDMMSADRLSSFISSCVPALVMSLGHAKRREASRDTKTDARLKQVLDYIDTHPEQTVSVGSLSERFYMSPSWLSHMFSERMGIGIMQYAARKRMLYAQKLINEGTPPTKAAELCGIDNYSTFYRQYRKTIGAPPRNGRKDT
ncbi:MAG: helix-turn-helix domain-containing protein [Clostridia bacterium]|nr:helix-turn-helix domain-containing protein [Clostridia bacterium]